ncbi:hypothetical protein [Roseofilum sp. Belize Diploria]|uniref:hypothetical protein n=1 Tax=Roseofilum sp. Belize Diploria TaxID=2821501 RepID=UPI001B0BDA18|nr:hypothetical protein [Roseofilum sp. Belize Diploria]MBP0009143.1 hypothetical protein [Roseofilum sp. Belize Diploria]
MKAYSLDLREKIVKAHLVEKYSIRQVSARFSVSKNLVHKLVKQKRTEGNAAEVLHVSLMSKKRG